MRTESTPPLWYGLGWLVHRAGVPVLDVRLVSVAENFALVALLVVLAAQLFPLRLAASAGVLVALGSEFSAQGRWIRAYELLVLLTVVLVFAAHAAALQPTRARLGALAAVVAAGTLTHYFFFFSLAATLAWLWLEPTARPSRRKTGAAVAVGLVPFAVWSPAFVAQVDHRRYGWIGPFDWRPVVETPLRQFTPLGSGWTGTVVAAVACGLCAWGAVRLAPRGPLSRLCVAAALVPFALAALTWASGLRIYADRNMIGIGPFLAVVAVAGLSGLPSHAQRVVIPAVLVLAVGSFVLAQRSHGPVFDRIAGALVAEGWRAGDAVVVVGNRSEFRSPLEWYLPSHPTLVAGPALRLRPPVFVIGGARTLASQRADVAKRRVDGLVVARLSGPGDLSARLASAASVFRSAPSPPRTAARGRQPGSEKPHDAA